MLKIVLLVVSAAVLRGVEGHGKLIDPPARNSAWRFLPNFPINYDDTALFCGGLWVMVMNGGCGICGDSLASPRPRLNENTGVFGTGQIVRQYRSGQVIEISVTLTANHLGHFEFSLCNNGDGSGPESGEDCFRSLLLDNGSDRYVVSRTDFHVNLWVQLPPDLLVISASSDGTIGQETLGEFVRMVPVLWAAASKKFSGTAPTSELFNGILSHKYHVPVNINNIIGI